MADVARDLKGFVETGAIGTREFPESRSLCLSNAEDLCAQRIGRTISMRFAYILRHLPYIIGDF